MALTVQASQNSTPSALNPDGSAAFPISVTGFGVASATATSVAPIYVNGTPNSLSLDLSGNLRVTGGGGGGAVTVADGADVAQGTTVDAAWTSGAGTVISLLKKIASAGGSAVSIADGADVAKGTTSDPAWSGSGASTIVAALKAIYAKVAGTLTTVISGSVAVTGTFFQATQPVSAASLPLPALAATSALQTTINTTLGTPMQQSGGSLSVTNFPATQPVSGAFWQAIQPVSGSVGVTNLVGFALDTTVANVTAAVNAVAAGTPLARGQTAMAGSQSVTIAGDQPIPSGDRIRNSLLAAQLAYSMGVPTNGFVPLEIPSMGL